MTMNEDFNGSTDLVKHNEGRLANEKNLLSVSWGNNLAVRRRVNLLNNVKTSSFTILTGWWNWGGIDNTDPAKYSPLSNGFVIDFSKGENKSALTVKLGVDGVYDVSYSGDVPAEAVQTPSHNRVSNLLNQWLVNVGAMYGVDVFAVLQRQQDIAERARAEAERVARVPK